MGEGEPGTPQPSPPSDPSLRPSPCLLTTYWFVFSGLDGFQSSDELGRVYPGFPEISLRARVNARIAVNTSQVLRGSAFVRRRRVVTDVLRLEIRWPILPAWQQQ